MKCWISNWIHRVIAESPISRRDLIRSTAATVLLSAKPKTVSNARLNRRVVIVGAGFSGLACAHELLAAGCEVTVLEARGRIGGRVHSVADLIPGKVVEAGGELLGPNHPTVMAYSQLFGLKLVAVPEYDNLEPERVVLDGKQISAEDLKAAEPDVQRLIAMMTDDARNVVPDQPWKSPDAQRLDQLATSDRIAKTEFSPLAKAIVGLKLTNDNTVPLAKQSYLGNLAQIRGGELERYWTETESLRCAGGNQQFAMKLAEAIGNERIRLRCPVEKITIGDRQVTTRDAHGNQYEADDLVLSTPPTTWRKILFEPQFLRELAPQMGHVVKNLAVVSSRFWLDANRRPTSLGDGFIGYTWCATEGQDEQIPSEVLTAFTSGPAAQSLSHPETAGQRTERYRMAYEVMQPGFGKALQNARFVDWVNDPWTASGYSFPAPGQVTKMGPLLQAGYGRMHFSGEHTCYQFVGYMEGGLNSGVATAKRLLAKS